MPGLTEAPTGLHRSQLRAITGLRVAKGRQSHSLEEQAAMGRGSVSLTSFGGARGVPRAGGPWGEEAEVPGPPGVGPRARYLLCAAAARPGPPAGPSACPAQRAVSPSAQSVACRWTRRCCPSSVPWCHLVPCRRAAAARKAACAANGPVRAAARRGRWRGRGRGRSPAAEPLRAAFR